MICMFEIELLQDQIIENAYIEEVQHCATLPPCLDTSINIYVSLL